MGYKPPLACRMGLLCTPAMHAPHLSRRTVILLRLVIVGGGLPGTREGQQGLLRHCTETCMTHRDES